MNSKRIGALLVVAAALGACSSPEAARTAAGAGACPPFPGFDQVQETYFKVNEFIPPGEHPAGWTPPAPTSVPQCSVLTVRTEQFGLSFDRPDAVRRVSVAAGPDVSFYVVGDPGPMQMFLDWGQGKIPPQTGNVIITTP